MEQNMEHWYIHRGKPT